MVATPQPEDLGAQLDALQRRIDEMERKTLYSASIGSGGLTVKGGFIRLVDENGAERLFIGETGFSMPPGETQPAFWIRDENGGIRFGVYDNSAGYNPVVWLYDEAGRVVVTTDENGGMAEPWLPVPMYPKFIPTNFTNSTNSDPCLPASACNGGAIWNGRIGKVSHPRIQFDITRGRVTGTNAVPTYSFYVNTNLIGTHSDTAYGPSLVGPFDISNLLGTANIVVEVRVSATGTGTDLIACGMNAVYLRQS